MKRGLAQQLNSLLSQSAEPLSIDELCQNLDGIASRRTILRRLDSLVAEGKALRTGKGPATRYQGIASPLRPTPYAAPYRDFARLPDQVLTLREDPPEVALTTHPLADLRDQIRRPQGLRKAIGYQRGFLDAYLPNQTAYLPPDLRAEFLRVAQSPSMATLPPGTFARQVLDRLIIDLSWNSSRLEGSTYSLLETEHLLAQGTSDDPLRAEESQMVLNHKAAIQFLVEEPGELAFNRYTVLNLHAILTEGLLTHAAAEGALRNTPVGITGTTFHPTQNPQLIEECFDLILDKAGKIEDPFECSFFLMVHVPYLQPFEDGNKRTSRLLANIPLIQANMAPLSFTGVPVRDYTDGILAVYELNRIELLREVFVQAYRKSAERYAAIRQEIGQPDPLLLRYRTEIKEQIHQVVVRRLNKPQAAEYLRQWARHEITAGDRDALVERIEERLLALTEGNLVRVRLRPSEYEAWRPVWLGPHR